MSPRWVIEKQFRFEASHQLPEHDGKCRRLHGHSWVGTVKVEGSALIERGPKAGMLIDFGTLSVLLKPIVDRHLDHHHLNESTGLSNPTSEELARWVYERLKPAVRGLMAVRIEETCTSACEYVEDGG